MAARLLVVPNPGQLPAVPDRADDLEAFFYVLVWIALRYTKHGFLKNALTDMLYAAFDHHYLDPDGAAKGGDRKKVEVCFSDPFQVSRLFNVPLKELIKTLAKTFAVRYEEAPTATELAQYNEILQQQTESRTALERLLSDEASAIIRIQKKLMDEQPVRKYMNRQDNLKRHGWMESELTTVLQKGGLNEHGDRVQRVLSTPPPTQPMVPKTEYTEGDADPISGDPCR
jgi:hypothetical protein